MPLVDSPRLLVWYESSVCLWCACGLMKSSHSFLAAVIWRREMHSVCYRAFTHESLMDCTCVRNVIVVAAAPQSLMHNRNAVQVHHTWTTSRTETAVCFALYCLRFALFRFTRSLPRGFLFRVIHVMQNWLQRCRMQWSYRSVKTDFQASILLTLHFKSLVKKNLSIDIRLGFRGLARIMKRSLY